MKTETDLLILLNKFHGMQIGEMIIQAFGVEGFRYDPDYVIIYFPAEPKTDKNSVADYLDSINELSESGKIKLKKGEIQSVIGSKMANSMEPFGPTSSLDYMDKKYWDLLNSYIL